MSEHTADHASRDPAAPGGAGQNVEYRVAHLRDRLAADDLGELGVRAEVRSGAVMLTGTVSSSHCRDEILRIAQDELAGLTVHCDIVVAETNAPDHTEELA
ncbi:BON domain-containing protein [Streptomyces sp. NPDC005496]|uniref:BON domain-containing protein n=1 Tax=unclassified Streptomyces TaxID=2593676 RepID=UPI0033ABB47C